MYESSLFSPSSSTFVICVLFDDSHLTGVRWFLTLVLICISLMINNAEHLFICLLAIHMSFLGKMSIQFSCHFLSMLIVFILCWVVWTVYIFWILTLIRYRIWKYFLLFKVILSICQWFSLLYKTFTYFSPPHPSGSSQCTSPEHLSHASNLG